MAECIVMLLGQVAMALRQEHGIIGSVVGIFKQRMFYPTSNLDISMVNELAKMAAKTGVRSMRVYWGEGESGWGREKYIECGICRKKFGYFCNDAPALQSFPQYGIHDNL